MIPRGDFLRTLFFKWNICYSPAIGFGSWAMYHGKRENRSYKEAW